MAKKENDKNAMAVRFLLMCEESVRDGLAKNKTEWIFSVGEYQQNWTRIERGDRWPTLEQVAKACELYGYSPTWLILNRGPKKLKESTELRTDQRLALLEVEVSRVKRLLAKLPGNKSGNKAR